ncbi:uncharacterized protein PHACADRAFT_192534 [Phanerochaete carnosa HHB-10118-sp]|uniref:Uncharacterized protein n=1 Tax=Phanerochaete carnosa (strain HHB-10118-sp) TaxID=650164 RepID=K5VB64_PHACS|nr:uncharacterized protein PHACADRAFT_192534 [Phanerochaete carnosa HHB-10118-sp]EKM60136.1 hypothetical protein PHACADRAFT_192534 [Phanerochaete carnosa HHB-10118-sp]
MHILGGGAFLFDLSGPWPLPLRTDGKPDFQMLHEISGYFEPDHFGGEAYIENASRITCRSGNDILSFYKEELAGDTKNFIHDQARVTGKDTWQYTHLDPSTP